jgi:hypothetical protein
MNREKINYLDNFITRTFSKADDPTISARDRAAYKRLWKEAEQERQRLMNLLQEN